RIYHAYLDLPPDTLSLHDALPISRAAGRRGTGRPVSSQSWEPEDSVRARRRTVRATTARIACALVWRPSAPAPELRSPHPERRRDRKSTRLNSSHVSISYAVFSLK